MVMDPRAVVDAYFRAMQQGQIGQEALLALFADDAVYTEPFTGTPRTHEGIRAIRACVEASWAYSPPGLVLAVDRVDVDGARVLARWTCSSPAFTAPVKGQDRYLIRDGKIARLEVEIVGP